MEFFLHKFKIVKLLIKSFILSKIILIRMIKG